jgi:O-antigen ligase
VWLALFLILAFSGFVLGAILCLSSAKVGLAFICVCGLTLLVILRQDQLAAVVLVATGLVLDWFIGTHILAVVASGLLLLVYYSARSITYPRAAPRLLWLWLSLLLLALPPAVRPLLNGQADINEGFYYYPGVFLPAFIMYCLGTTIVRTPRDALHFFQYMAFFATLVALHALYQARTGVLLFATANARAFLLSVHDYQLGVTGVSRVGSFFLQPDAGSAFFAMLLFFPLALALISQTHWQKALALLATTLLCLALLATYSTGAWVAAAIGLLVFWVSVGALRWQLTGIASLLGGILLYFCRTNLQLLWQHSSNLQDLTIRQGLWQTAWAIIGAYPLTGIGLSRQYYLSLAARYYVAQELIPLNNPHNAYLEIAALAGLPVLVLMLSILGCGLWQVFQVWRQADPKLKVLWVGGFAALMTLLVNNWSFGLWTYPPLVIPFWLILGVLSSPLLNHAHVRRSTPLPGFSVVNQQCGKDGN